MTDNEIKKALECCINDDCDNCPDTFGNCEHNAMRNALNLINRQQAEIKRLKKEQHQFADIGKMYSEIRAEAIKEFAEKVETELDERVSESIRNRNPHWHIAKRIVRETAIEMTEVSDEQ